MFKRASLLAASLALISMTSVAAIPAPISVPVVEQQSAVAPVVWGLTGANRLVAFRANSPGSIMSSTAISGLATGERILGIDVRPATNQLFGVSNASQLYLIDPMTANASRIGSVLEPILTNDNVGVDFNPQADRLRIVTSMGQDLRIVPDTGAVTVDGPLTLPTGGTPMVNAAAYTNSFAGTTSTTLYVIDAASGMLMTQGSIGSAPISPNSGQLLPVGPLGMPATLYGGFDISANNVGYAVMTNGSTSTLAWIDLASGRATSVGPIGGNDAIIGIAIAPALSGGTSVDVLGLLRLFANPLR